MSIFTRFFGTEKHRGSSAIADDEGEILNTAFQKHFYKYAYNDLEIVRRGVDLIVDLASEVEVSINGRIPGHTPVYIPEGREQAIRQKKLDTILNYVPNDVENMNEFRRQLYLDLILTGDCFQYFDGEFLYHIPSHLVTIKTDRNKKVKGYELNHNKAEAPIKFTKDEIIHTKDNSAESVIRGETRLRSSKNSIRILGSMLDFQEKFFENGTILGLIITTPNVLGKKIKERTIDEWSRQYNPKTGAKRPIILDGDMRVNPLSQVNFRELDFENSIEKREVKILKALGVPPILLESGNNANIMPNMKLLYYTTILPLVKKLIASYEAYFGFDLEPETVNIESLRPDQREQSAFLVGLVNGGIITINEARYELRMPKNNEEHADQLRIPANIAGSASNPNEGGRPDEPEEEENED